MYGRIHVSMQPRRLHLKVKFPFEVLVIINNFIASSFVTLMLVAAASLMIHFSMRLTISSASGFFVSLDVASSLVPMFCCLLVVDFEFEFFVGTRFSTLNINRFKTGSRPGRMETKRVQGLAEWKPN